MKIKKKTIESIEYVITLIGLILYSGAILTLFTTNGFSEGDSFNEPISENTLIKQIFFAFYCVTAILIICRWQRSLYVISKNIPVLLVTVCVTFSVSWSIDQSLTINRTIALSGTYLFGVYIASRYTLKQQVILLSQAFGIIIFLSMLLIIFVPKYGIMSGSHAGAWRGVFNHKNVLGKWMVPSTAIFYLQSIRSNKIDLASYLGIIFSIVLTIGSRSSSPILNLAIIIVAFLILKTWRWRYEVMVPASIAITLLGIGLFTWFNSNASVVFSSLGKGSDLSGRTELWNAAWQMVQQQPLLGYGYGSFWDETNPAAVAIWRKINWDAPNAHNGFLDLLLSLGCVGLFMLALSFLNTFIKAFICLRQSKTPDEFWLIIFMIYLILSNLTESALMLQNDLFSVIYITISYTVIINTNSKTRALVYGYASQN